MDCPRYESMIFEDTAQRAALQLAINQSNSLARAESIEEDINSPTDEKRIINIFEPLPTSQEEVINEDIGGNDQNFIDIEDQLEVQLPKQAEKTKAEKMKSEKTKTDKSVKQQSKMVEGNPYENYDLNN